MSTAPAAQPGVFEPVPVQGRYLTGQLRVGADPRTVLRRLASRSDSQVTIVGLDASLARELPIRSRHLAALIAPAF